MTNKSGVADQVISLPKGGGALKGMGEKFQPNLHTGTGNFSIPITIPAARNSFQPQLTLTYSTGNGNGAFGLGWSLGIPGVTRKTSKGIPRYRDRASDPNEWDTFVLSGAEDLVPVALWKVDAVNPLQRTKIDHPTLQDYATAAIVQFRPRTEGLFAQIFYHRDATQSYWEVRSKDGITSFYGRDESSRLVNAEHPDQVFQWVLSETRDLYNNRIVYHYRREDQVGLAGQPYEVNHHYNQLYLSRIDYANYLDGVIERFLFSVEFDYGDYDPAGQPTGNWSYRPDPFSTYRAGFEIRSVRRCQRILTKVYEADQPAGGQLIKAYCLQYQDELQTAGQQKELPLNAVSLLSEVVLVGYGPHQETKSFPPLTFQYTRFNPDRRRYEPFAALSHYLPEHGLNQPDSELVDLHGFGLPDVVQTKPEGVYYWRNLGDCRFDFPRQMHEAPAGLTLARTGVQFADMEGTGSADLLVTEGAISGYFPTRFDAEWDSYSFVKYSQAPSFNLKDPDVKLVDMDGDGVIDVLRTGNPHVQIYYNRGKKGWDKQPQHILRKGLEEFPDVYFSAPDQRVRLAAMGGDGLQDIVLIHDRRIEYWPNLGYGRWGKRITMHHSPQLPKNYDLKRLFLSDIDGDGYADLVYVDFGRVHYWINQSGNAWSEEHIIHGTPAVSDMDAVRIADMKGTGTAGILWSYDYSSQNRTNYKYLDLTGGVKPYLLHGMDNHIGAITQVTYAPSTRFAIQDWEQGHPWKTHLPFPVQVVERVETHDAISRNRLVTRYSYHQGFYDGVEREFRGFGFVEQQDTESFTALSVSDRFPQGDNIDAATHVPPVLVKTWFHTGAFREGDEISRQFALGYFGAPSQTDPQYAQKWQEFAATLLPDTILPSGLTVDEMREACRVLNGSILRQETYALDGSEKQSLPYSVSERNYTLECLQKRGTQSHAVFFVHPCETIDYHFERNLDDPRVSHSLVLEVDEFGNVLKTVAIGYGRRANQSALQEGNRQKQEQWLITYTENDFTHAIDSTDCYRAPLPCESRTYELTNYTPTGAAGRFQASDFVQPDPADSKRLNHICDSDINYEDLPSHGRQHRLIDRVRTLYRPNDLGASQNNSLTLLPLGEVESLALPGESYKLALTPGLLAGVFQRPHDGQPTENLLPSPAQVLGGQGADQGGYVDLEHNGHWWIPSGRVFYSTEPTHSPAQEWAVAQAHFFLPRRHCDPFGASSTVTYDRYDLLLTSTRDAICNEVYAENDYRVQQPWRVTDPNGNYTEVAFDVMGMVVGTAIIGKNGEGDTLANFKPEWTDQERQDFFNVPRSLNHNYAAGLLKGATTRIVYDLYRYQREGKPIYAATLTRETHVKDLPAGTDSKIQVSFSYSDGFGREIQKKIQAEPGPIVKGEPAVNPRWVGSGWTIFNNKGKPVRQYEPFFSVTHEFEFARQEGVSSILFYDPLERVVATLHPNHTYEKVVFDPWQQTTWDVNDTVTSDPRSDADVQGYVDAYFAIQSNSWETWRQARINGALGVQEQIAATKATAHANTPTVAHFDALGRPFLTVADNGRNRDGKEQKYETRVHLDIEGNQREVVDALGRVVMRYDYDLLGNRIHQSSMDAGDRWMLNDVAGKPIRSWDGRGHRFRTEYDRLRRSLRALVVGANPNQPNQEVLVERLVYGEQHPEAEQRNLRGVVYLHLDQAGAVTNEKSDFKGNPLQVTRRLSRNYQTVVDWSVVNAGLPSDPARKFDPAAVKAKIDPLLEAETFTSKTIYDALNRPIQLFTPSTTEIPASVIQPAYNEANLLEKVEMQIRGATTWTTSVSNIDYNEKGQRSQIEYGNGVTTNYSNDQETFRLTNLRTTRKSDHAALQNLSYTYDPVGNITDIRDDAQQTIFFKGQVVSPNTKYEYDALYRLIQAEGREHRGQTANNQPEHRPELKPHYDFNDSTRTGLEHPHNGQAMRNYTEIYRYDEVGNILAMIHQAESGDWTRHYDYAVDSNRLRATSLPGDSARYGGDESKVDPKLLPTRYTHDGHGNLVQMPHLAQMDWDFKDQLHQVDLGGGGTAYYVYDASGQRVRKVVEKSPGLREERIYLGGFEIFRRYNGTGLKLERETLHVMDDKRRIALIETKTFEIKDDGTGGTINKPKSITRYQFDNHLGSAVLELDEAGKVISYEEYHPYGTTSYQAVDGANEVSLKRYRYTGKERDEENGFYYHGMRYYAPWLGRWASPDSVGLEDGVNLYQYVKGYITRFVDPKGTSGEAPITYTAKEIAVQQCMPAEHSTKSSGNSMQLSVGHAAMSAETTVKNFGKSLDTSAAGDDYFRAIPPDLENQLKTTGQLEARGVKKQTGEAQMTVRHASPDAVKKGGTDRISFTKDPNGAVQRAKDNGGGRANVVRVNPDEVKAAGGRFKTNAEIMADVEKVKAARTAQGLPATNSEVRQADRYFELFEEGQALGATPRGTVKPIGPLQGRNFTQTGREFGEALGPAGLVVTLMSNTPAGEVVVDPLDPHFMDSLENTVNVTLHYLGKDLYYCPTVDAGCQTIPGEPFWEIAYDVAIQKAEQMYIDAVGDINRLYGIPW